MIKDYSEDFTEFQSFYVSGLGKKVTITGKLLRTDEVSILLCQWIR